MLGLITLSFFMATFWMALPVDATVIERESDMVILSRKEKQDSKKFGEKKSSETKDKKHPKDKKDDYYKEAIVVAFLMMFFGYYISDSRPYPAPPYEHPTTPKELLANIVHAMFINPKYHKRNSPRKHCVNYNEESYFSSEKAYWVFMRSVEKLGRNEEERKEKLIEDALNINYKEYNLKEDDFDKLWKKKFKLPLNFDDMVYKTHPKKQSFQLKEQYQGKDGKASIVCGPGFHNKDFVGGYGGGACAYHEWRMFCGPPEPVKTEYIKYLALEQAKQDQPNVQESRWSLEERAYKLREVYHRVYILDGVSRYINLGLYGHSFMSKNIKEILPKITDYNAPYPKFNVVASAAPDQSNGAGKIGEEYDIEHMKAYCYECYISALAEIDYFFAKDRSLKILYIELGNKGSGAYNHAKKIPYLVQLFAYECAIQDADKRGRVRLMLYPFDDDGEGGLKDARELHPAIVKAMQDKSQNELSMEEYCQLVLDCHKQVFKEPLKFAKPNKT